MEKDHKLYTDEMAARLVAAGRVGKPYRPANGSEFEIFSSLWCDHCLHEEGGCLIMLDSWFFEIGHPDYPADVLRIGADGHPECLGFTPKEERTSS